MNDGLPHNYDAWKLATPWDDEKHTCDMCDKQVNKESDLFEASGNKHYELICQSCAEDYQTCSKCFRSIVASDYDHDEYCDSCCDKIADSLTDRD